MSMDLYLWKSPVTDDPEEAGRLINRFFDAAETGVFEPSPDIAAAAEELQRLYPIRLVSGEQLIASMSDEERSQYTEEGLAQLREHGSYAQDEDGPWSDLPHHQTDNLLALNVRWSAGNKVLDDIVRIGRERELVIYDPQGPSVYLPDDPVEPGPPESTTIIDVLKFVSLVVLLCGLTYLAWMIPIGWIRWPAVIIAGFVATAGLFVLFLILGHALGLIRDEEPH